jgi:hypothetical protein
MGIEKFTVDDLSATGLGPESGPAMSRFNKLITQHNKLYSGVCGAYKRVYVSPNGSDLFGNGTLNYPFLTIKRAMEEVPTVIPNNSYYAIMLANGKYKSFPNFCKIMGGISNLVFDGYEHPVAIDSNQYEVQSVADVDYVKTIVTLTTSPFTTDQHYGKMIRMTSGDYKGYTGPIVSNTASTITTQAIIAASISAGDTFEIVNPGVEIETDSDIVIKSVGTSYASTLFYNIALKKSSAFSGSYVLQLGGTADFTFISCVGVGNNDASAFFRLENCRMNSVSVNSMLTEYLSFFKTITSYPYGSINFISSLANLFGIQSYVAPSEIEDAVHMYYSIGGSVQGIIVRGLVQVGVSKTVMLNSIVGKLSATDGTELLSYYCCFDAPDGSDSLLEISKSSKGCLSLCHFEGTLTESVIEVSQSEIPQFVNCDSDDATAPYFAKLNFSSKVMLADVPGSTNSTEDVYFYRSDSAAAFPASGASVNDSEASYLAIK